MSGKYDDFSNALALGENYPTGMFEALAKLSNTIIGVKLFTLMTFDAEASLGTRIYSNMPDAYPPMGTKPVETNKWTRIVLDGRKTFVANTIDEIAEVFGDFELIRSLGCQSCINIPVIVAGQVLGTLNCLHEANHYTPDRVAASRQLMLPGAAAFLSLQYKSKGVSADG